MLQDGGLNQLDWGLFFLADENHVIETGFEMLRWLKKLWDFVTREKGIHGLDELARRLDLSVEDLKAVQCSYQEFQIRKKSGKPRNITAPEKQLKYVQRKIHRRLLAKLKCHPMATGFQPGVSFVDNARIHQAQEIVVKIDLVDFFPAISEKRIRNYFRAIGWRKKAARLLTRLVTHHGVLPQGAPTSPRLSNLVNHRLDSRIAGVVYRYGGVYSRYADDITISFEDGFVEISEVIMIVMKIIRLEGYTPHTGKKFSVRRSHQRQVVTGLVVNDRANLPRSTRRWLRAVEHRTRKFQRGGTFCHPPTLSSEQLEGWRSLQRMIKKGASE